MMHLRAFIDDWKTTALKAVEEVAEAQQGSWYRRTAWPTAVAMLDWYTACRFALDHERETAHVLEAFPKEAIGGTVTSGVVAQIEPFEAYRDVRQLAGLDLRLMGFPFDTKVVYRIVNEAVERR